MFEIRRIFSSSVFEAYDIEAFHAFAQKHAERRAASRRDRNAEKEPCACGDQGA
jgi:hypothetical protein